MPPDRRAARVLRLGTRGSQLALIQAHEVAAALEATGIGVGIVIVRTAGDDQKPDTAWGEGAFVGALESRLLDGSIDLAVHSAKDVPTSMDPRLGIAAFRPREDPRDALVGRQRGVTLATLPLGARVGTDSPRRTAFLLTLRPDLRAHPLNGNVDTRLRRLDSGESDALVLAVAGLTRLGRADRIDERIATDVIPPAPGQGAVAVQVRVDDTVAMRHVGLLDDAATRACAEAERAFLHATGGGCRAPIGCNATLRDGTIHLVAGVSREPVAAGTPVAWSRASGPAADAIAIAQELASRLRPLRTADGLTHDAVPRRPAVLITRPREYAGSLVAALDERGLDAVVIPTIEIREGDPTALAAAAGTLATFDWVVVTSVNGAKAILAAIARAGADPAAVRWAAVGTATAAALEEAGVAPDFIPERGTGEALGAAMPVAPGERVLLARTDIADERLPERLEAAGATVAQVVAYRTVEAPEPSRAPLAAAVRAGSVDAIVFTSGSTVRGLLALLPPDLRDMARGTLACCIGEPTASAAAEAGFTRIETAASPRAEAVADLAARSLLAGASPGPAEPSTPAEAPDPAPSPDPAPATTPGAVR